MLLPALVAATLLSGGIYSSCNNKSNSDFALDSVKVDTFTTLTKDTNSPKCKVYINMMCADKAGGQIANNINTSLVKALFDYDKMGIKAAVDSFSRSYLNDYKTNIAPIYKTDKSTPHAKGAYDYFYLLNTNTEKGKNGNLIYVANLECYEGGAHGITQTRVLNFNVKTGKCVKLTDILLKGYEKELNDLLLKSLQDKVGAKNINDLRNKGYLMSNEIYVPDNYYINDDGITFLFNPYEIAPYAMGKTELRLSNSDLKNIMK